MSPGEQHRTQNMSPKESSHITEITNGLLSDPLIANIISVLKRDLSPKLPFHSWDHTVDVIKETIRFALDEGVNEKSLQLLAIAGAFHDAGFLVSSQNNEEIGAQYAKEAMMASGRFTLSEIRTVERMIIDTKLCEVGCSGIHNVSTDLSGYLLDGDLSNFGREDFLYRAKLRLQEVQIEDKIFYEATLSLLKNHRWQTQAAETRRQPRKLSNIRVLQQLIDAL